MRCLSAIRAANLALLVLAIWLSACEKLAPKPAEQFALRFAHDGSASFGETNQYELMSVPVPSGATTNILWVERKVQLGGESIRDVRLEEALSDRLQSKNSIGLRPGKSGFTNAIPDSLDYGIVIEFSERGREVLQRITKENIGRHLVIVINGKAIMAPVIQQPIQGGTVAIHGFDSKEEANRLADTIRSCMKAP
jgi:hypothetical protein